MKKFYKVLAASFALSLIVASPATCITSHALGFNAGAHDDTDYGTRPSTGGSSNSDSSSGGSSNSGSSNSGSTHTEVVYNEAGEAQTVVVDGGSSSVKSNYTPGSQTSAAKQRFREVVDAGAGTYKVIHCGSEKMTFTLKGADGKAKAADSIALKTLADGRWAINFAVKDATGCTVGAPLDRTYMYDTLGVSCVTINDTVIIDIAAESAAK